MASVKEGLADPQPVSPQANAETIYNEKTKGDYHVSRLEYGTLAEELILSYMRTSSFVNSWGRAEKLRRRHED